MQMDLSSQLWIFFLMLFFSIPPNSCGKKKKKKNSCSGACIAIPLLHLNLDPRTFTGYSTFNYAYRTHPLTHTHAHTHTRTHTHTHTQTRTRTRTRTQCSHRDLKRNSKMPFGHTSNGPNKAIARAAVALTVHLDQLASGTYHVSLT